MRVVREEASASASESASAESGRDLRILEKRNVKMDGRAREEASASASSESDDGESVRESASSESGWNHLRILEKRVKMLSEST